MKISKQRAAEIWCELNCWYIPKEFKKTTMKRDDINGAMIVISYFTTQHEIDKTWSSGHCTKRGWKRDKQ